MIRKTGSRHLTAGCVTPSSFGDEEFMGLTPSGTKAMRFSGKDFGCLSIVLQGYSEKPVTRRWCFYGEFVVDYAVNMVT
jgi:hypothetical protein